jgi:uncharacterized membrane protein YdjX (TVP38/TMEM64 family)
VTVSADDPSPGSAEVESANASAGQRSPWRRTALGITLLAVLSLTSFVAFQAAQTLPDSPLFRSLGYLGVFLLTMTCSATLFLPVPAWGAVTVAGGYLHPLFLGLAAGAGAATGELTGYLAGRGGRLVLGGRQSGIVVRVSWLMDRHGFLTLFLLSAIPNPLFDVAGLTAGSLKYPPHRYWLAVALGKSVVYITLALGGQALFGAL